MIELRDGYGQFQIDTSNKYDKDQTGRIQCDIPKSEYQFLQLILPSRSDAVIQRTVSQLVCKLIKELKNHGITSLNEADEYREFVNECRIIDSRNRITVAGSMSKTDAPNERRGIEVKGSRNPSDKNIESDIPSKVKRGKDVKSSGKK